MEERQQPVVHRPADRQRKKKKWLVILLVILLIAAAGGGAYWWRDKKANTDLNNKQDEVSSLQDEISKKDEEISSLKKKLAAEKKKNAEASSASTATTPSASDLQNIQDSITSRNTAALESYMASTVNVVLAASEGIGPQTPTQAVADVDQQLLNAKDPWNFNLPAATLSSYQNKFYSQYFPDGALVGKSANGQVISFTFDNNGKISGIFFGTEEVITM